MKAHVQHCSTTTTTTTTSGGGGGSVRIWGGAAAGEGWVEGEEVGVLVGDGYYYSLGE